MTYHSDHSRVTNSSLKLFARAPILWKRWHDGTLPEKRTPDLTFGSLVHCLQFEPENLGSLFALMPDDAPSKPTKQQLAALDRFHTLEKPTKAQVEANEKTVKATAWWADFNEASAGKDLIDQGDNTEARACLAGLAADPKCREFLALPGLSEVVIEWTDEATGLPCKAKLDRIARHAILDLKTAADASEKGFRRAAYNNEYHRQAAWYLDGVAAAISQNTIPRNVLELVRGISPEAFVFTAVEKDENHLAHCFVADADFIQRGRDENTLLMRELKHCITTKTWPGLARHESGMTSISLPSFVEPLPTQTDHV